MSPGVGRHRVVLDLGRRSGDGGSSHVSTAPVVDNALLETRLLLIDWVVANEVINPADFVSVEGRLVSAGAPITIT